MIAIKVPLNKYPGVSPFALSASLNILPGAGVVPNKFPINPLDPSVKSYIWYENAMMQNKIMMHNQYIAQAQKELKAKMIEGKRRVGCIFALLS